MNKSIWMALSYSVPMTPSKARVYVWRKLRGFGAEYLRSGVALLPNSSLSLQQFTTLAQKIRQMGGEATVFDMRFADPADEQALRARFFLQAQKEYQGLLSDCALTVHRLRDPSPALSREESETIRRLVKRYCEARSRDYFKAGQECLELQQGLSELRESVRGAAGELGRQLRALLDAGT